MTLAKERFDLWLEFEHWEKHEADDPEDEIFNLQIALPSGKKYAINVWTYQSIDKAVKACEDSGECLDGSYLLPPDLFVHRLDRELLEQIAADLIARDALKSEWEVCDP